MFPISRRSSRGSRHNRSRESSNISSTEAHFQGLHLGTTSASHSASASPPSRQAEQGFLDPPSFSQAAAATHYLQPGFDSTSSATLPGSTFDVSHSHLQHSSTERWPVTASVHPSESDLPSFQLDRGTAAYSLESFDQDSRHTDPYARDDMK